MSDVGDRSGLGGTWKAIVAQPDGGLDALADTGPWYLLDGRLAFNNRAQLKTTPLVPISVDEQKRSQASSPNRCVWTGLHAGGAAVPGCAATGFGPWTFGNSAQSALVGTLDASDAKWLDNDDTTCNAPCRLYCIEQ